MLLDDCQWADQLTFKVLNSWQRQPESAKKAVLVVVAFRSEEVPTGHPLRPEVARTLTVTNVSAVQRSQTSRINGWAFARPSSRRH